MLIGRHWMRCSPDEVAARVPDPLVVAEMASFLALEAEDREKEREREEKKRRARAHLDGV